MNVRLSHITRDGCSMVSKKKKKLSTDRSIKIAIEMAFYLN